MCSNFVYVFSEELKNKLLAKGAHMLKEAHDKSYYIFNIDQKCLYALYDSKYGEYTISSTLSF